MAGTLGALAVGSVVKLKENGIPVNYLVVHQGLPGVMYDASCNGTWLLRQDIIERRVWDPEDDNKIESSDIQLWLNSTMLGKYDVNIQASIKQVRIPYLRGGGNGDVQILSAGMICKVFLLSGFEVGFSNVIDSHFPPDGSRLSYFEDGTGVSANNKRIANLDGRAAKWWLRSPYTGFTYYVWNVLSSGSYQNNKPNYSDVGVRPALVLPSILLVSDDGSVTTNTAPTAPPSISVPQTIYGGSSVTISWGASSDAQGNLEGYILERSTNGGSSWSQIYQGGGLSTINTVGYGTYSVMYRVKAYDSEGLQSGYRTSSQVIVINNTAPTAPGSITVPQMVVAGGTLPISWTPSTDAQGDTINYQLERSINSGATWEKIYEGGQVSFTDSVNQGWSTVMYRVRAYDVYSAFSAYTTSEIRRIEQLAVISITVPAVAMQGQTIPVSWAAVASADSYVLERKANTEDAFVQIYAGPNTSYTDTAGSWETVQYRVKAGLNGTYGMYQTAKAVPVVPTSALVISGADSDLGVITADVPYTVSTDTGNTITLTRKVNGNLVATLTVQSGFAYTIPVMDLPTGSGAIEITASVNTSGGAPITATRKWTYTKVPIDFPNSGGVAPLYQNGKAVFPPTLAEAVRVPAHWGGSLDKALEMLLSLVNSAVIQVGAYEGTGTFGVGNPNTLTFNQEPVVVTIYGGGQTLVISNTDTDSPAYINGKTARWYSTESAAAQMNTDGTTYSYVAVGKQV